MRANPSKMSHEELDNAEELDEGDPSEFADSMTAMQKQWNLRVLGGCCGSDWKHLVAIAEKIKTDSQ